MPYNNTPIRPPDTYTGTVYLPLARIKKIISADDDISACSNNAAFAITAAAEEFIFHMARMTHNVVKSERRRRGAQITYQDVSNAVARVDTLEFLSDIVPKTTTLAQYRAKKAAEEKKAQNSSRLTNGQRTLDQMTRPGEAHSNITEVEDVKMADSNGIQINGHSPTARVNGDSAHATANGGSGSSRRRAKRSSYDAVRDGQDVSMEE